MDIGEQGYTDYAEYLAAAGTWAYELSRVLRLNGRLALNVPFDIARGQCEPLASDWLHLLRAAGFTYRTTVVSRRRATLLEVRTPGSIDLPSAINPICPAELVLIVHKGEWDLGRTGVTDFMHDEWLS